MIETQGRDPGVEIGTPTTSFDYAELSKSNVKNFERYKSLTLFANQEVTTLAAR